MLIFYIFSFAVLLIFLIFTIVIIRQSDKNIDNKIIEKDNSGKKSLIKVVYFDEESASDFLYISAGGKEVLTYEKIRERSNSVRTKFGLGASPRFDVGVSGDINVGLESLSMGKTIINKNLWNTILTDYLEKISEESCIEKLENFYVAAQEGSMAYIKMYTPYMVLLKMDEIPINLSKLDEVLAEAKGYYELLGRNKNSNKPNCVLRFNINAFRNNYRLVDLSRMNLVFYGVEVGKTSEQNLSMQAEMSGNSLPNDTLTALDIEDGKQEDHSQLKVYDVVLAGVEKC